MSQQLNEFYAAKSVTHNMNEFYAAKNKSMDTISKLQRIAKAYEVIGDDKMYLKLAGIADDLTLEIKKMQIAINGLTEGD